MYAGVADREVIFEWYDWLDTESASASWDSGGIMMSKDGGATFKQVGNNRIRKDTVGADMIVNRLAVPSEYLVENFQVRFDFYADGSTNAIGWYVDDVSLYAREPVTELEVECVKSGGGLVAGYVFDSNFPDEDVKLIGANVSTESGGAETLPHPNHPEQKGLYYFFQGTMGDSEDKAFTVTKDQYDTVVETRNVAVDVVNHHDFSIGSGMLSANPSAVERTIFLGDDPETTNLTLVNEGYGTAEFEITEMSKGWQPYAVNIPAFTGEIPEDVAPTSIFRSPESKTSSGPQLKASSLAQYFNQEGSSPAYGVDLLDSKLFHWAEVEKTDQHRLVGSVPKELYAGDFVDGDFSALHVISTTNNGYYKINTQTGEATLMSTVVLPDGTVATGLAGANKFFYGVATKCGAESQLFTMRAETGAISIIGTIPNSKCLIDIAWVPEQGALYGVDLLSDHLIKIDPTTGVDTSVGPLGINANYAQGMDYDEEAGIMYWAAFDTKAHLRVIDLETGASEPVGDLGLGEVDTFAIASGGGDAVPWLSETPLTGTITPRSETNIELTFDVSGIKQPGDYFAELTVQNSTPYPGPVVPVTLHVVRPATWGNIKGKMSATQKCDEDEQPLARATVNLYQGETLVHTLRTDSNGDYNHSLPAGIYTVEVIAPRYVTTRVENVQVPMSDEVWVNITARLDAACLTVSAETLYQELALNDTATQTLRFTNTGAADAYFEFDEQTGEGPIPFGGVNQDVELILDDGTYDDAIGLNGLIQFMVLNRFTPDENLFPFTLDQVHIYFGDSNGAASPGDSFEVYLYQNATSSEDPAVGSEFLYKQAAQVTGTIPGWTVVQLDHPVTFTGPGDVLIGAGFLKTPGGEHYPAAMDTTQSNQRSWAGWWDGEIPETPTLPPTARWTLIDALPNLAGNWMLRGYGRPGQADIPWLSEDPTAGIIEKDGGTYDVELTFDSNDLSWGDYFAKLNIKNIPDPRITLPVQLRVMPDPSMAFISGTVRGMEACNINPQPLHKALVNILEEGQVVQTFETMDNGFYKVSLAPGTYDVEVLFDGFESKLFRDITIETGENKVVNVDLRILKACIVADPQHAEKWLKPGTTGEQNLVVRNIGPVDANFEILERSMPAPQPAPQSSFINPEPSYERNADLYDPTVERSKSAPQRMGKAPGGETQAMLIDEGFEGTFPPDGWKIQSLSTFTWHQDDQDAYEGTYYAQMLYDEGMQDQSEWLITPELFISEGTLKFWSYGSTSWCRDIDDNCDLNVWVLVGELGDEENILIGKADDVWPRDWMWAESSFDLRPYLTGGPIRIAIEYRGNDGAEAGVDAVKIDGVEGMDVPWLDESPLSGELKADSMMTIKLDYDATGLDLGDYYAGLVFDTTEGPRRLVPVTLHVVEELPVYNSYFPTIMTK